MAQEHTRKVEQKNGLLSAMEMRMAELGRRLVDALGDGSSRYLAQDVEDHAEDVRARAEALARECGGPAPGPRRRAGEASGLGR
ncbi:hypothetical protein ACH4VM_36670 [Streptomyces sp. NPDC020792]|uniref:hypothetical protein n=1 Tax=Streptomyces sp. NPDC020792 TaxID=3365089 RepID=UPI003787DA12